MAISRKQLPSCPIERALACISARYKAMIIHRLFNGPCSYGELARVVVEINERMLTLQLKQLVDDGIIDSFPSESRRRGVSYRLTDLGDKLQSVFAALECWGKEHHTIRKDGDDRNAFGESEYGAHRHLQQ